MLLTTVIPITKGVFKEDLTYYTSRDIAPGALVTVPVRNKTITALVVSTQPVSETKIDIKQASYGLRAIKKVIADSFFSPEFIEAAQKYAVFAACPVGMVIDQFSSRALLEGRVHGLPHTVRSTYGEHEEVAIQASSEERFGFYKSFIREEFAKKRSVLFVIPTLADVHRIAPMLTRGIEEYSVVLTSDLTATQLAAVWKKALDPNHPVLIVATPGFISVPRRDFGAILFERESSHYWKHFVRPYLDARQFGLFLGAALKTRVVWGDLMLRTETLWRAQNESFVTLLPLKFRSLSQATCSVADLRATPKHRDGSVSVVSLEARDALARALNENGSAAIYVHRKGLASTTVCDDCGSIVTCTHCSAPLVLHGAKEHTFFLCHKCWNEQTTDRACGSCQSWRLTPLGIGIDRFVNETKTLFPDAHIFTIDSDTATTHKRALEIADQFFSTPHSILIGTDMMIPYLRNSVHTTVAGAIDSLFSIPDFRMSEKIFHTLLTLRSLADTSCVIQTRSPSRKLFSSAVFGTLIDFYRDEIAARTTLKYPPLTTLIKITREGPEHVIETDMKKLYEQLKEWEPLVFPSFSKVAKGARLHALIKIERRAWPHKKLHHILTSLSPDYVINVDPDDII